MANQAEDERPVSREVRVIVRALAFLATFALLELAWQLHTVAGMHDNLIHAGVVAPAAFVADRLTPSLAVRAEGTQLRANLAHPVYVRQHRILPFGWAPYPRGWYQVNLNARGVLQSSLILLIVILSWPSTTVMELVARLCLTAPMLAGLIMLDAPLELLGNLQEAVARPWDPHGFRLLFAWDRFLEGGGNAVLALVFAACAIAWAARPAAPAARLQSRRLWAP